MSTGERSSTIEAMKQWVEGVSKAYDLTAWGHTERAAEILRQTRNTLHTAIEEAERYEEEKFKPDWMNYQEGFAAGVLEGREQMKQAAQSATRPATREEKIVNPGVYEVPYVAEPRVQSEGRVEPVAYAVYHRMGWGKSLHWPEQHSEDGDAKEYKLVPLYAAPPAAQTAPVQDECVVCGDKVRVIPRPWVGFTNDEFIDLCEDASNFGTGGLIRHVEQRLKEKNT